MIARTANGELPVGAHQEQTNAMTVIPARPLALVVDDCKVSSRIASKILADLGFDTDLAVNGKQALFLWSARDYAFILMDFEMPEMNGIEATRAIRLREKVMGYRTPIIGHSATADGSSCLASGMDDFLKKPASRELLMATISNWCNPYAA